MTPEQQRRILEAKELMYSQRKNIQESLELLNQLEQTVSCVEALSPSHLHPPFCR